jgi:hypothetical protein
MVRFAKSGIIPIDNLIFLEMFFNHILLKINLENKGAGNWRVN